mgnify:CR=1 FL=1
MSDRQPGDYVVNSELTQQQIQRFVGDCVEAGAKDDGDSHDADNEIVLCHNEGNFCVGGYYFEAISLDGGKAAKNDVTKENTK